MAITRRPSTLPVRVHMNAPSSRSTVSASTFANSRRNVASSAVPRVIPSGLSASSLASAAHSPIAVNERAPARTAAIPTGSSPASG